MHTLIPFCSGGVVVVMDRYAGGGAPKVSLNPSLFFFLSSVTHES
jgi:hypothetical protein